MPTNSNPAHLISRGIEATAVSTSTLWWKCPQWLTRQPSDWPRTVVNTPTENLELTNVHVAVLHSEVITQGFSKLNRLIRVVAYCKRFISNYRNSKANRHSTTLSTHELDQALTFCVKIVQQESYDQELKELGEKKWLQPTVFLKHCIHSLTMKILSDLEEDYSIPIFLIKQDIR